MAFFYQYKALEKNSFKNNLKKTLIASSKYKRKIIFTKQTDEKV